MDSTTDTSSDESPSIDRLSIINNKATNISKRKTRTTMRRTSLVCSSAYIRHSSKITKVYFKESALS